MEGPERQLTLVSFYGEKPAEFAAWIRRFQQMLSASLSGDFEPYSVEQIHGTIIGLEGACMENGVRSDNRLKQLGEESAFDFRGMLHFLRSSFDGFTVQVGGFQSGRDYPFLSQGHHPFVRSFSIQRGTAVAMGWPVEEEKHPCSLDQLRRALEPFGALRKWAWHQGEVDNDFYFVLGRVTASLNEERREAAERHIREQLASSRPLNLSLSPDELQFVSYIDRRLTPEGTRVFPLKDTDTTAEALTNGYGFCSR